MPAASADQTALLWFTRDLRLHDQPALRAALAGGRRVVACYVLDEAAGGGRLETDWAMGGASRWWLHHSLAALGAALEAAGAKLVLRRGESAAQIVRLAREVNAAALHVGQPNEPAGRAALDAIEAALRPHGCAVHRHWTTLLFDPEHVRTAAGTPYGVFTPFSKACLARGVTGDELPAPRRIAAAAAPDSDDLESWGLLPTRPDWAGGLRAAWRPGEAGAFDRLHDFVDAALADYAEKRNLPAEEGVSRLSPYLHWGEISARSVWRAAAAQEGDGPRSFLNELLWREFSGHLLWHHPALPDRPLREPFAAMQWRRDAAGLRAWQRGRTGIPIVDAGMRQLWQTGWQHNRVRMITASFLIKHLLIDWRLGEAWFWDCLVDADLGSNSGNWQWVAGCGADAAPFFRIFNPWLQGRKFDPDGAYVKRYVPELAGLAADFIHAPWEAPDAVLAAAGVRLGGNYPAPIVDLAAGRARALAAFARVSDKVRA
jgi:deoxyribodipyrimidine photo-lyase